MKRLPILVWLAGLALAILCVVRTPIATDMSAFLPDNPAPGQRLLVSQLREGVVSRLVLIAIGDAPRATIAAISHALADRLRTDDHFTDIANGDPAAFERTRAVLEHHRYLLSPATTAEHFTQPALRQALDADVALLGTDLAPLIKRSLPADPTGEMLRLLQSFDGQSRPRTESGIWVSRDGTEALLTASTRAAGFDIDGEMQALHRIHEAFHAIKRAMPEAAGATLTLTGPPVFAVATRARIQGDAERLSIMATLLVAGVLIFAYRSIRLLALGLLPVLSGALAGVASVSLVFGFVHGITLGFGVTLIGEAVDYAIYLFTRTPPGAAPAATLPRIWPTLRLGMMVSVCGFSAMLFSHFTGFAQLGLFTIAGLVTALAVTRFVLPALMPVAHQTRESTKIARPLLALIRNRARLRWAVLAASLAAAATIALHGAPYWEDELSSMSPIPAVETRQDTRLRAELGAPDVRVLVAATAPSREAALLASEQAAARLRPLIATGAIAGFDAPSRLLPSEATQRARRAALPEAASLRDALAAAAETTMLRPEIFVPFLADVEAARTGPLLTRADFDNTPLAQQIDTLMPRQGVDWLALLPLRRVTDPAAVQAAIATQPGLTILDLKQESDNLLASYRSEAVFLSIIGSLVILALLAASLRGVGRIIAVVAPLAAAVLCTAAIMLVAGGRLSIFNLFGLLLTTAVGSNYTLFFEREETDQPRMVASLTLANICTVIGFGILSISLVPVLHGIGTTVAIGTALSLLFGAILSPRRT